MSESVGYASGPLPSWQEMNGSFQHQETRNLLQFLASPMLLLGFLASPPAHVKRWSGSVPREAAHSWVPSLQSPFLQHPGPPYFPAFDDPVFPAQ